MRWLGQDVPKGTKAGGHRHGAASLSRSPRPVRLPVNWYFSKKCMQSPWREWGGTKKRECCRLPVPVLWWGNGSFNTGAGYFIACTKMVRFYTKTICRRALPTYCRSSAMPRPGTWRPSSFHSNGRQKEFAGDWPDIRTKPVDHPFGPFADTFSVAQHKYGPFGPIQQTQIISPKNKP